MTISYQRDVASSTAGGFTSLLFKWKGSLYKLIFRELLLFLSAFILLSLTYRKLLNENQKELFEMVVKYFDAFLNLVPLSFVLGFYVSYVAGRWWQQFLAIPWPDKLFHSIACFVEGFDEESRILRRSLMRYMNLALILVLRSISSAVKQRFPTLEHVVEAGFMTNQEKELFQAVPCNEFNTYWIPCTWFVFRIQEAAKKKKLLNEYAIETIMREFCEFRSRCGLLWCYDWVSIPMVYTQMITFTTYVYFVFTLIGRQKIDPVGIGQRVEFMRSSRMPMDIDIYIPIFTILQFFFYMGLLKVAEQLINPFGDDDEDFELNWLVDRHMKASFLGCDILMDPDRVPPMVKDYYWDKQNCPIPYTEASMHFKRQTYKGSAADVVVPESKQHMVLPEIEEEEEDPNRRASKLSLTSLLLDSSQLVAGIGSGYATGNTHNRRSMPDGNAPMGFGAMDRSPKLQQKAPFHPGSWRGGNVLPDKEGPPGTMRGPDQILNTTNGTDMGSELLSPPELPFHVLRRGSEGSLPWGSSMSVESGSDDEETPAEGGGASAGNGAGTDEASDASRRRESKLTDLLEKKKRGDKKRRKPDKQGFVWRRMIHDQEELPRQRTPSLGPGAAAYINQPPVLDQQRGRPSATIPPQSVPANTTTVPLTSASEMTQGRAVLLNEKPPPPIPLSTPLTVAASHTPSHVHRPTPHPREQHVDNTLQQLQHQVPDYFRSGANPGIVPQPDDSMGHGDVVGDGEQPPPLITVQKPQSSIPRETQNPQNSNHIPEPRILKPAIQPPTPTPRSGVPAFVPRQGSAPPRFGGSYAATMPSTNGRGRERVRSTSASGSSQQPMRKISSTTDPGTGDSSLPAPTFRQQQLQALSGAYDDGASLETDTPSGGGKSSSGKKLSLFGKSEKDKDDEVSKVLHRSNAYAAERPTSPSKSSSARPASRSDIGLVPQPFGTSRSPPVSAATLEEAQAYKNHVNT